MTGAALQRRYLRPRSSRASSRRSTPFHWHDVQRRSTARGRQHVLDSYPARGAWNSDAPQRGQERGQAGIENTPNLGVIN